MSICQHMMRFGVRGDVGLCGDVSAKDGVRIGGDFSVK